MESTHSIWSTAENFKVLLDHLQEGVLAIESDTIVFANRMAHEVSGYPPGGLVGLPFWELIAPENRDLVIDRHSRRLQGEKIPDFYEILALGADRKTRIPLTISVGMLEGSQAVLVTIKDLRNLRRTESELQFLQNEMTQIIRKLPDIYYRTDMRGMLVRLSPSVTPILGYRIEDVIGTPLMDYYVNPEGREEIIRRIIEADGEVTRVEAALRHSDGHEVWFCTNAYLVKSENGEAIGIEGLARDDTNRRQLEQELLHLSRIDALTGLDNRHSIFLRAEEEFQRCLRYCRPFTLLLMDLDHFKAINDMHGHHVGDVALKLFAGVCMENLRESDSMGRIGGEEFLVVLPETDTAEGIVVAERICNSLVNSGFDALGERVCLTVSVGIASLTALDGCAEDMQLRADRALYEAKASGRNCIRVHHA